MTVLERNKHIDYIQKLGKVYLSLDRAIPTEGPTPQNTDDLAYHLTSHLRLNAVYWGFTAVSVMGQPTALERDEMIEFVMSCWDEQEGSPSPPPSSETYSRLTKINTNSPTIGAFATFPGHDAHLLSTLSAIQILVMHDALDKLDKDRVTKCESQLEYDVYLEITPPETRRFIAANIRGFIYRRSLGRDRHSVHLLRHISTVPPRRTIQT